MSDVKVWRLDGKYELPVSEPVKLWVEQGIGWYTLDYGNDRVLNLNWSPYPGGPQIYNYKEHEWEDTPWHVFEHELGRLREHCERQLIAVYRMKTEMEYGRLTPEEIMQAVDAATRKGAG